MVGEVLAVVGTVSPTVRRISPILLVKPLRPGLRDVDLLPCSRRLVLAATTASVMLRNFIGLLKDYNNDIIEHRIVTNQDDEEDRETEEASWFACLHFSFFLDLNAAMVWACRYYCYIG